MQSNGRGFRERLPLHKDQGTQLASAFASSQRLLDLCLLPLGMRSRNCAFWSATSKQQELRAAPCALPCIVEVVALWLRFAFESPARKCCSRQRCQRKTRLAQATMSPQQRHALRHICFSWGAAYAQYWAVFFFFFFFFFLRGLQQSSCAA